MFNERRKASQIDVELPSHNPTQGFDTPHTTRNKAPNRQTAAKNHCSRKNGTNDKESPIPHTMVHGGPSVPQPMPLPAKDYRTPPRTPRQTCASRLDPVLPENAQGAMQAWHPGDYVPARNLPRRYNESVPRDSRSLANLSSLPPICRRRGTNARVGRPRAKHKAATEATSTGIHKSVHSSRFVTNSEFVKQVISDRSIFLLTPKHPRNLMDRHSLRAVFKVEIVVMFVSLFSRENNYIFLGTHSDTPCLKSQQGWRFWKRRRI